MGFLDSLRQAFSSKATMSTGDLLKQATAYKRDGDLDAAVDTLRAAYRSAESDGVEYGIKTYLRLPLYLQKAGRPDEAWGEFNRLLSASPPGRSRHAEVRVMEDSIIYDKMRLFLQREGQHGKAVTMGVASKLMWIKGLYMQKRTEELKHSRSEESIREALCPLLKKAKVEDKLNEMVTEIMDDADPPSKIDVSRAGKRVNAVLSDE